MILISNLTLDISDSIRINDIDTTCTAVPATEIYGTDKKTYINIGSGNVFRLYWETPSLTNNDAVDHYNLIIKRHDIVLNVYYDIFDKNIGLVNEFYVDSSLLPALPLQYKLSIYIIAYSKNGSVITSNIVTPYISKGTGTYVKVQPEGYKQAIWKRALAFANAPTLGEPTAVSVLLDSNGKELLDAEGNLLTAEATRVLYSDTWNVMQEGYTKASDGTWKTNDLKYEVLVDKTGEVITDSSNTSIYVL